MAHGPYWWVGPIILMLVVFGPPVLICILTSRKDS
jgi:hypothetical protein